jgi:GT2 family glycosyltransferase
MRVDVSVVIPARAEGPLLPATVAGIARARTDLRREVIVVDDGTPPGRWQPPAPTPGLAVHVVRTAGEGAAAARNRGARLAAGGLLCFCDAHVAVPDGWLDALVATLAETGAAAVSPAIAPWQPPARPGEDGVAGYGYTWTDRAAVRWLPRPDGPAPVPFLPGACLLVRREAFAAVGGFDAGLVPWGHEDSEFSLALWLTGRDAVVAPQVCVGHRFRARHPYVVLREQVDANLARVAFIHFRPERLRRFATALGLLPLLGRVAGSPDAQRRRALLQAARRRDDDWFCARFGLAYWDP